MFPGPMVFPVAPSPMATPSTLPRSWFPDASVPITLPTIRFSVAAPPQIPTPLLHRHTAFPWPKGPPPIVRSPPIVLFDADPAMKNPHPEKSRICRPRMTFLHETTSKALTSPLSRSRPLRMTPASLASITSEPQLSCGKGLRSAIVAGALGGKIVGSNVIVSPDPAVSKAQRNVPAPASAELFTINSLLTPTNVKNRTIHSATPVLLILPPQSAD